MTRIGPALLLVLSLVVTVPATADDGGSKAVDVALSVAPFDGPVMPITGRAETPVTATLSCDSPADVGENMLTFDTTGPEWAGVLIEPSSHSVMLNVTDCLQEAGRVVTSTLTVALSADAPAFEPLAIQVTAAYGDATATADVNGTVGYFENIHSRFEHAIIKAAPGRDVDLPLTVENRGNAAIIVTTRLAENSSDVFEVSLPEPFPVAANATVTLLVEVETPTKFGYENRRDAVHLTLRAAPEKEPEAVGEPMTVTAVIQTQGLSTGGAAGSISAAALGTAIFAALVLGAVIFYRSRSSS